jgi:four helix bundle protein
MLKLNHKKLNVWKLTLSLIKDLYKITENFPKSEIFGITNQIRRASVSIASNIAEGASRKSTNERKRFFEISRSSLVEIDTQIEISLELNLINKNQLALVDDKINHLFAMMSNLIAKSY